MSNPRMDSIFYFGAASPQIFNGNITSKQAVRQSHIFGIFKHSNLNLSFDFAQDGELVEPFRISIFGFSIS